LRRRKETAVSRSSAFDVVVVGAGPAGLSAARTTARLGFSTLVLEQLPGPGELSHPCSAIIAPVPRASRSDLYFRKIDLVIPRHLVLGYPSEQYWTGPEDLEYSAPLGGRRGCSAAVVDKGGLLRDLAAHVLAAGAEMRFDTAATGLLRDGASITGVQTTRGNYDAQVVISAEGLGRHLCGAALPASRKSYGARYGFVIGKELRAPAVDAAHLGQYITLGRRYTSARDCIGMAVAPAPGRLAVFFVLFADGPNCYTERSAHFYLEEYMHEDPRVREFCEGAQPEREYVARMMIAGAPGRFVADGLMGVGDAVTPGGYLGILPAVYMGRKAALVAAQAIDSGDTSASHLAGYEAIIRPMWPDLEAEAQTMLALSRMSDFEIGTFFQSPAFRRQAPFSAHTHALRWDVVGHFDQGTAPARTRAGLSQRYALRGGHPAPLAFHSAFV
jgi:flavin-dependent dehydrogenase